MAVGSWPEEIEVTTLGEPALEAGGALQLSNMLKIRWNHLIRLQSQLETLDALFLAVVVVVRPKHRRNRPSSGSGSLDWRALRCNEGQSSQGCEME